MKCFGTIALLSGIISLAACSAGVDDDSGSVEQGKHVKPVGTEDHTTGTVTVTVPASSPTLASTTIRLTGPKGTFTGHLAETLTVPVGAYDVQVGGSTVASYDKVDVKGGKAYSITLPVIAPIPINGKPKPASLPPQTFTFGPRVTPLTGNPAHFSPAFSKSPGNLYANPLGANVGIVAAPGAYEITRPNAAGGTDPLAQLTVTTPKVYTIPPVDDAWGAPKMNVPTAKLEVKVAASDYPLVHAAGLYFSCQGNTDSGGNFRVGASYGTWNDLASASVASTAKTITGTFYSGPGCSFRLMPGSYDNVTIDPTQPLTQLSLESIDVDDVEITHASTGLTRAVKGTYTLSKVQGPGQPPKQIFVEGKTGTAMMVFPGTYVVDVVYTDNAATQTKSYTVTVP